MKIIEEKNFAFPIIYTQILDDNKLLVVDENTSVRFLDLSSFDTASGFKANITHSSYSSNMVYFSPHASYFISCSADAREAKLYNTETKKAIAKVNRHQGEVSCVGIDPKSRYMFSSGDDGKTFGIDIKTGKLVFTLPAHTDTINDIAFSSNGQWVATASYDRKISVFNLSLMTPKFRLKAHSSAVMKLRFLKDYRLFSIDKKNSAIIWNMQTGRVITRLQGIHDDVTQVATSSDCKFLFLGTKLGYVLVYNLDTYELIAGRYIKLKDAITSIVCTKEDDKLIVGTKKGALLVYNIHEGEEYLVELLKEKKYEQMQDYLEKNPLLEFTKSYQMVDIIWNKIIIKAKEFLASSQKDKAMALFTDFKNIPIKKQIIQKLFKDYLEFDKFAFLVKQNKLALAYNLAAKHKAYKDSSLYEAMELKWKKTFAVAQKYVLDPSSSYKAKDILAPYRGIVDKAAIIHELLANIQVYKRLRVFIAQKDFKMAFNLMKKYPFLTETTEYSAAMNYADKLYIKSHELIKKGDTSSVLKLLHALEDFDDYKEEAKELLADIENRQKFFTAVLEEKMEDAYNLLSASEYLQDTKDGMKLIELWEAKIEIANAYAIKGDASGVKTVLADYLGISSKSMSIATVFSLCYISQLENAIRKKQDQKSIEKGIKNYLLHFGVTEQVLAYFSIFKKYYKDTKLNLDEQKVGSFNMWRPAMIVSSILD